MHITVSKQKRKAYCFCINNLFLSGYFIYFSGCMKRFLSSFGFAFKGLAYAFKTQLNFRVHCIALILVIGLGLFFKLDKGEWLWIAVAVVMVLSAELINTALEVLVDLVSPQIHPKAGAIKDLAAAAVLVAAMGAVVIGLLIFFPKFF